MLDGNWMDEADIIIEIDTILNNSGNEKELPKDLGGIARNVVEEIGAPFVTVRSLPSTALLPNPVLMQKQLDEQRSRPDYKLVGSLERAAERSVEDRNTEVYISAGNGRTSVDLEKKRHNQTTMTSFTVTYTLERGGRAVPGSTTMYRTFVRQDKRTRSYSVFLAGTGPGSEVNLSSNQEVGDALRDATAASIIQLIGNALVIPYYRCNTTLFTEDQALVERFHTMLERATREDLEQRAKRLLFASGFPTNMQEPTLTEEEQQAITEQMRARSLDFNDRDSLMRWLMEQWKTLDFRKAARIRQEQLDKIALAAAEANLAVNPAAFQWPASASDRMLEIDLKRVPGIDARKAIITAATKCSSLLEMKAINADFAVIGAIGASPIAQFRREMQSALRQGGLSIRYVWTGHNQQRLVVAPITAATNGPAGTPQSRDAARQEKSLPARDSRL
jgi:hypothetical protein